MAVPTPVPQPKALVVVRTNAAPLTLAATPAGYSTTCVYCPGVVRIARDPKTNALLLSAGAVCLLCGQRYTVPVTASRRQMDFMLYLQARSITRAGRS